jgi:hypothetical protein
MLADRPLQKRAHCRAADLSIWLGAAAMAAVSCLGIGCAAPPARIDQDAETDFAIYRSGRLGAYRLRELCEAGVEEIVVMDGTAQARECRLRNPVCPGLRVRYNEAQDPRSPVSRDFLEAFSAWVEESRASGKKIAFRCRHGWHRTGRVGAFYRMRFQGWSLLAARDEMEEVGRFMWTYPGLQTQLDAIADYLATGDCRSRAGACPQAGQAIGEHLVRGEGGIRFPSDVCSP